MQIPAHSYISGQCDTWRKVGKLLAHKIIAVIRLLLVLQAPARKLNFYYCCCSLERNPQHREGEVDTRFASLGRPPSHVRRGRVS